MPMPKEQLAAVRDDVAALVAVTQAGVTVTRQVIEGVSRWFDDVEIRYPIAEMQFSAEERKSLIVEIGTEMLSRFTEAAKTGVDESTFPAFAQSVDRLWRELTGALAPELNSRFEDERIPAEEAGRYLRETVQELREMLGDDVADEYLTRARNDSRTRTQLRRIGVDPDC